MTAWVSNANNLKALGAMFVVSLHIDLTQIALTSGQLGWDPPAGCVYSNSGTDRYDKLCLERGFNQRNDFRKQCNESWLKRKRSTRSVYVSSESSNRNKSRMVFRRRCFRRICYRNARCESSLVDESSLVSGSTFVQSTRHGFSIDMSYDVAGLR